MTLISEMRDAEFGKSGVPHFDERELIRFVRTGRGYTTVHHPVFDEFGAVVEANLVWWNDAYERVRITPPSCGEAFVAIASDGPASLAAMTEAWNTGHCVQHFEFKTEHAAKFGIPVLGKQTWTRWMRSTASTRAMIRSWPTPPECARWPSSATASRATCTTP